MKNSILALFLVLLLVSNAMSGQITKKLIFGERNE